MNAEIKAKWIAALRSGKYKQGNTYLRTEDGKFCCLGVLCDVMGMHGVLDRGAWAYDENTCVLPQMAQRKAGVIGGLGDLHATVFLGEKECSTLSSLNDAGADFNFIADVIEKQL